MFVALLCRLLDLSGEWLILMFSLYLRYSCQNTVIGWAPWETEIWNGNLCAGPLLGSDLWINTSGRERKEAEMGRGKSWATITVPRKASASANPFVSYGVGMAYSEWGWGSWTSILLHWLVIGWKLLPNKGITLCLANFSSWGNDYRGLIAESWLLAPFLTAELFCLS